MPYTKVIYRDELECFLDNFKELVSDGRIEVDNKRDVLVFLEFFKIQLYETVLPVRVYDLRDMDISIKKPPM